MARSHDTGLASQDPGPGSSAIDTAQVRHAAFGRRRRSWRLASTLTLIFTTLVCAVAATVTYLTVLRDRQTFQRELRVCWRTRPS